MPVYPVGNDIPATSESSIQSAEEIDISGGDVTGFWRGLYVGTAGDVEVVFAGDSTAVILPNLAAGVWHPMVIKQVNQAGTSALDIFGGL